MCSMWEPSEYECNFCDEKQEVLDTCKNAATQLFTQLYLCESPDVTIVDDCMNELVSYLKAIDKWPKDLNGNYLKAKIA